jgi:hypothetical protein
MPPGKTDFILFAPAGANSVRLFDKMYAADKVCGVVLVVPKATPGSAGGKKIAYSEE